MTDFKIGDWALVPVKQYSRGQPPFALPAAGMVVDTGPDGVKLRFLGTFDPSLAQRGDPDAYASGGWWFNANEVTPMPLDPEGE